MDIPRRTAAVLALVLPLLSASIGTAAAETWSGSRAEATDGPVVLVARDDAEWDRIWARIGRPAPRLLGFGESAVAAFAGMRPTGGWSVRAAGAVDDGHGPLVLFSVQGPPPGTLSTQALTSPWTITTVRDLQGLAHGRILTPEPRAGEGGGSDAGTREGPFPGVVPNPVTDGPAFGRRGDRSRGDADAVSNGDDGIRRR